MLYAVVTRYENEDFEFCEWKYKSDDSDGIYGRVYLITGRPETALKAAAWAEHAKEGAVYEFPEGEIVMQFIG